MKLATRAAAAAAILTLALSSAALRAGEPILWVEDSFEDFADGKLDAAGQNLYVSREGALRTIHRFDLTGTGIWTSSSTAPTTTSPTFRPRWA